MAARPATEATPDGRPPRDGSHAPTAPAGPGDRSRTPGRTVRRHRIRRCTRGCRLSLHVRRTSPAGPARAHASRPRVHKAAERGAGAGRRHAGRGRTGGRSRPPTSAQASRDPDVIPAEAIDRARGPATASRAALPALGAHAIRSARRGGSTEDRDDRLATPVAANWRRPHRGGSASGGAVSRSRPRGHRPGPMRRAAGLTQQERRMPMPAAEAVTAADARPVPGEAQRRGAAPPGCPPRRPSRKAGSVRRGQDPARCRTRDGTDSAEAHA
jgi:hypothetical protein